MSENNYMKSPLNYTGGKYQLLPQVMPLFPKKIDTFVDLFCGGLNVSINVVAKQKICNDAQPQLIDFFKHVQKHTGLECHSMIQDVVNCYSLSKENSKGFMDLRADYNKNPDWVKFYSLIAHSFNHQIRFNSLGEYNVSFGKSRSYYNKMLQKHTICFGDAIDNSYSFENRDFRTLNLSLLTENSLVYADPPYLISTATYNEGNGWTEQDDLDLFQLLDDLNERHINFAMSNVFSIKGKENKALMKWARNYNVFCLDKSYANSNYQKIDRESESQEVLITNYAYADEAYANKIAA